MRVGSVVPLSVHSSSFLRYFLSRCEPRTSPLSARDMSIVQVTAAMALQLPARRTRDRRLVMELSSSQALGHMQKNSRVRPGWCTHMSTAASLSAASFSCGRVCVLRNSGLEILRRDSPSR